MYFKFNDNNKEFCFYTVMDIRWIISDSICVNFSVELI